MVTASSTHWRITEELTSVKEIEAERSSPNRYAVPSRYSLRIQRRRHFGEHYLHQAQKRPSARVQETAAFKNGEIVDAIVHIDKKIALIDSKFSENYNRFIQAAEADKPAEKSFVNDLKLRIQETAKHHIRPEEGTMDFVLATIPSEGIYYDLLTRILLARGREFIQRAAQKIKTIVSSTSFLAHSSNYVWCSRHSRLNRKAAEIQKRV